VHHLNARIPNYNLQRAHDENPVFHQVPTLSLADGLRAVRLKLWDESRGRLVTFALAREFSATAAESTARPTSTASASEGLIEQVGNARPSAETPSSPIH
jgi:omega-6 fatty acid desaturase (delta-12 desaturase)